MQCLCCQSQTHTTSQCTSTRAQTINDAVSHWILNRLEQLYRTTATTMATNDSVHWLATTHHMTRLSIGDLLYLMRDILLDNPRYMKERLIYIYLHYMVWTFYQTYEMDYSPRVRRRIQIDIAFWHHLSNGGGINVAEEIRRQQLQESASYQIVEHRVSNSEETITIDCAVCWNVEIMRKNTHQYNCTHVFCTLCSESLLENEEETVKCPLCRSTVQTIVKFVA